MLDSYCHRYGGLFLKMEPIITEIVGFVLKGGTMELGKRFTEGAIAKMKPLRQLIITRLQGKPKAKEAIAQLEAGSEEALENIISYLKTEMQEDKEFCDTLEKMVSEIKAERLQDPSTSMLQNNWDNATGFQTKAEPGSHVYNAKEIHYHKST